MPVSPADLVRQQSNGSAETTRASFRDCQKRYPAQPGKRQGVSMRSGDELVKAMGMTSISKNQVS
jgi:hypothetical protein